MRKLEETIAKTWIPNAILISVAVYVVLVSLLLLKAESWQGPVFYTLAFGCFLAVVWHYNHKYDCQLTLTESQLRIHYFHPSLASEVLELNQIRSDIKIERYHSGFRLGAFPRLKDYLNHRWYFAAEEYRVYFLYGDANEPQQITLQPNIIGFESFMKKLVTQTNRVLDDSASQQSLATDLPRSLLLLANILLD